ncbi:MAG: HD domain-containing protein [Bacillaceae bacterium]|nr:HD domain-containing protein [Bacillaceae bacterium]
MFTIQKNIHQKLIQRLVIGSILLSIIIGTAVYVIELEKIDHYVVDLANRESEQFQNLYRMNMNNKNQEELKQKSDELIANHFIIVELYNQNKEKILESIRRDKYFVETELKKYTHKFPLTEQSLYERFNIDNTIYLQVLVPIENDYQQVLGYFEGVYQVDQKTMSQIKERIVWSLVQTIMVIFLTAIMLYPVILALNKDLIQYSKELLNAQIDLLDVMGSTIAKRDTDTNEHNYRVTIYAVHLAEKIILSSDQIKSLIKGSFLHDIGKIGITDEILLKPGKLTDEEYETMKTHVQHGVDIVENSRWLNDAKDIIHYHHEKYDGSGYLKGLKHNEIPVLARIFAIADVFDALSSKRPYKKPFSFEKTIQLMEKNSGSHFDPELFHHFKGIAESLHKRFSQADHQVIQEEFKRIIKTYFYNQS